MISNADTQTRDVLKSLLLWVSTTSAPRILITNDAKRVITGIFCEPTNPFANQFSIFGMLQKLAAGHRPYTTYIVKRATDLITGPVSLYAFNQNLYRLRCMDAEAMRKCLVTRVEAALREVDPVEKVPTGGGKGNLLTVYRGAYQFFQRDSDRMMLPGTPRALDLGGHSVEPTDGEAARFSLRGYIERQTHRVASKLRGEALATLHHLARRSLSKAQAEWAKKGLLKSETLALLGEAIKRTENELAGGPYVPFPASLKTEAKAKAAADRAAFEEARSMPMVREPKPLHAAETITSENFQSHQWVVQVLERTKAFIIAHPDRWLRHARGPAMTVSGSQIEAESPLAFYFSIAGRLRFELWNTDTGLSRTRAATIYLKLLPSLADFDIWSDGKRAMAVGLLERTAAELRTRLFKFAPPAPVDRYDATKRRTFCAQPAVEVEVEVEVLPCGPVGVKVPKELTLESLLAELDVAIKVGRSSMLEQNVAVRGLVRGYQTALKARPAAKRDLMDQRWVTASELNPGDVIHYDGRTSVILNRDGSYLTIGHLGGPGGRTLSFINPGPFKLVGRVVQTAAA